MKRYNIKDVQQEEFYQLQKWLFKGKYKGLTSNARLVYAILRDRMSLSAVNFKDFTDPNGDIYLIYNQEDLADHLVISVRTVRRSFDILKKYNLMEIVPQYNNLPSKIYLINPDLSTLEYSPGQNVPPNVQDKMSPHNKTYINKTYNNNNNTSSLVIAKSITSNNNNDNDKDKDRRGDKKNKINKIKKGPHYKKTSTNPHLEYIIPEQEVLAQLIQDYELPADTTTRAYISRVLEIYYSTIDEALKTQNSPQILDPSHIAYVINGLNRRAREIKSFDRYVKASLKNAERDYTLYLQNITRQEKIQDKENRDEEKIYEMWKKKNNF